MLSCRHCCFSRIFLVAGCLWLTYEMLKKHGKISLWKLIKKNCTSLGKWKRTSYTVWQILHSWDPRFDRYQKWLCQLVPAAGIGNGKLCWFLFGFLWVFSSHVLCLFYPFKEIHRLSEPDNFFHQNTFRDEQCWADWCQVLAKEELRRWVFFPGCHS